MIVEEFKFKLKMNKIAVVMISLMMICLAEAEFTMPKYKKERRYRAFKPIVNPKIMDRFEIAHHTMIKRMVRKGLTASYVAATSTIDNNSIEGFLLGIAYGLQYNPTKQGPCYQSLESSLLLLSEVTNII